MRPIGLILAILAASLIASYPEYAVLTAFSKSNLPTDILLLAFALAALALVFGGVEEYYAGIDIETLGKSIRATALAVVAAMKASAIGPSPPMPPVMVCPSCSNANPPDARFCARCGKPVSAG